MEERTFARDLRELEAIFEFIQSIAARHSVNERVMASLCLATEELFTNILKYHPSGPKDITIEVFIEGRQFRIAIIDPDAPDFDPLQYQPPETAEALRERAVGGLGLHLVRHVVDEMAYEYKDRQSRITLTKNMG